jgi:proteasome lid subunit RPN8/RPN11
VLRLTPLAVAGLRRASAEAAPKEACGVLAGRRIGDDIFAEDVIVARGAAAQGAFEISDHELRRMTACAESRGLGIVAIFHSHPSGTPDLSAADRAMLRWSRWAWVVVAGAGPAATLAAYAAGAARPIAIQIAERPRDHSTAALAARVIYPTI